MKYRLSPVTMLLGPLMASILVACGTLFVTPKSVTEKIAAAYVTHTAVLTATTNAVNAEELSSADAAQVLTIATESRKVIDAARVALTAGDTKTAEGKLALATSVLLQLQTYLRDHGH